MADLPQADAPGILRFNEEYDANLTSDLPGSERFCGGSGAKLPSRKTDTRHHSIKSQVPDNHSRGLDY